MSFLDGKIMSSTWERAMVITTEAIQAAEAEAAQHRKRAAELQADLDRLDPAEEFGIKLAELRRLVAGKLSAPQTLEALRAALAATFDYIELVQHTEDDGFTLLPYARGDSFYAPNSARPPRISLRKTQGR